MSDRADGRRQLCAAWPSTSRASGRLRRGRAPLMQAAGGSAARGGSGAAALVTLVTDIDKYQEAAAAHRSATSMS